jgi:hypothetical protein
MSSGGQLAMSSASAETKNSSHSQTLKQGLAVLAASLQSRPEPLRGPFKVNFAAVNKSSK